ncbi:hypothetical protein [Pontibacillus halophilus]|uniref:hypothetical protein n=1 Tax=Pontibacillus halophilus TaxID=516704 RepID=UPI00047E0A24|nr:hypothetical protein [Pontibacillus halophilus]
MFKKSIVAVLLSISAVFVGGTQSFAAVEADAIIIPTSDEADELGRTFTTEVTLHHQELWDLKYQVEHIETGESIAKGILNTMVAFPLTSLGVAVGTSTADSVMQGYYLDNNSDHIDYALRYYTTDYYDLTLTYTRLQRGNEVGYKLTDIHIAPYGM